jgi:hypothetical protein
MIGNSPRVEATAMATFPLATSEPDVIEELKLRRWARENYVPAQSRDLRWHPVVLEEMRVKDRETGGLVLAS